MYDRTIPVFTHALTAMSRILDKAEAHCADRRIDPLILTSARLYPDMFPMSRQIQIATDHARRCPARLTAREPLGMEDTEKSFAELRDRIARTVEHLASFGPADFEGAAEREISFRAGGRDITMSGARYLDYFALPNFWFHLTTGYDILRHNGVPVGKTDFLGG